MKFYGLVAAALVFGSMSAAAPARAQGCGPSNPNCVVPTPPPNDNSNRAAPTNWVQQFLNTQAPLASGKVWIGSAGNVATAQTVFGDCTLSILGSVICTKTNGVAFAPSATTDTTNASNIGSGTLAGARVQAINLAAGGNGGVTGALPNGNLANPSATVNGTTCTLGSSCTLPVVGGWHIANVSAANDVTNVSTQMDLNADWATFYNPSTGALITKGPLAGGGQVVSNLGCNISSAGPVAGGRDQAAAFASTNVVWWYLIINSSGNVSCITSLVAPTGLNSSSKTGPNLPSGYIAYAPAFPIVLVGSATLTPTAPQGGSTSYLVSGNTVSFATPPYINTGAGPPSGFPSGNISFGTWVPISYQLMTTFWTDIEAGSSASTVIGGAIIAIAGNNVINCSLYVAVVNIPAVCGNNGTFSYHLPSTGIMKLSYCGTSSPIGTCAAGSFNIQIAGIIAPMSYTFTQ